MLNYNQENQKLKLSPVWEKTLNSSPTCCEQLKHRIAGKEERPNVRNNAEFDQNL